MKGFWAGVLGLVLGVAAAVGQGEASHRILLHVAGSSTEVPSLVALVTGAPGHPAVVVSTQPPDAGTPALVHEAQTFGCDIILGVTIAGGQRSASWTLGSPWETGPRGTGSGALDSGPQGVSWQFLADALGPLVGPQGRAWPQALVVGRATLVVEALPGTLVEGLPPGPLTVGESGSLTVDLAVPVALALKGHRVGVKTTPLAILVDRSQRVTLYQSPEPEWALTASLENWVFPSLGVEWAPGAGRLVLRGALDQYEAGLALPPPGIPLVAVSGGAAWTWSWPEDALRFYTGTDVAVRWMFPGFRTFTVEPVIPMTVMPLVGWEYRWTDRQAAYFELGPTFLWVPDPGLFLASLSPHASNATILIPGVPWAFTFPFQAKAGYRWSF